MSSFSFRGFFSPGTPFLSSGEAPCRARGEDRVCTPSPSVDILQNQKHFNLLVQDSWHQPVVWLLRKYCFTVRRGKSTMQASYQRFITRCVTSQISSCFSLLARTGRISALYPRASCSCVVQVRAEVQLHNFADVMSTGRAPPRSSRLESACG